MTIILDSDELAGVTSYRTPKRQLAELHRQSSAAAHHPGAPGRALPT